VTRRLSERDRQFFGLVKRAAFANPFSSERALLDAEIGETDELDPEVLKRMSVRVAARMSSLAERSELILASYADDDRELLFAALLFEVFHRYIDEIDALIETPGRVRFAKKLLSDIAVRGVSASESVRALELFYQLRRAHLAIGQRLLGGGDTMRRLREELWNSVFTYDILRYERHLWSRMEDFSTLLIGETGTGKGEAARAIGRSGFIPFDEQRGEFATRVESLFVAVNLSEFSETLIESELFGHRRGAFTGAIDHHAGALARVEPHGTLFLDEIGEVNAAVQVKLLRVLQDREFTPVGARESVRFRGRVVAATHRPLEELRRDGHMRDDFYYRVATQTIEVPSLRTRLAENVGELALLVSHICARITGEVAPEIAADVLARIERALGPNHPFHGNVRELEQCVRRVLLTGRADAPPHAGKASSSAAASLLSRIERAELDAESLLRAYCELLYERSGSYVQVAKLTGLDRRTVRRHLKANE
jgi:transcriptional regulator with GAF, ATPase, and Fis domain